MDLRFRTGFTILSIILLTTQIVKCVEDVVEEPIDAKDTYDVEEGNPETSYDSGYKSTNISNVVDDEYISSSRSAINDNTYRTVNYTNYVQPVYYQRYRNPSYMQSVQTMYGGVNYNYRQPPVNHGYRGPNYYNQTYMSSPYNTSNPPLSYQNLPGTYQKTAYNTQHYFSGQGYRAEDVYSSYLASGAYLYYSGQCAKHYGQTPQITSNDMDSAFDYAYHKLRSFGQNYGNYSYTSQSPPLLLKEKEATLMEYVTEYFGKYKCLSKYQSTTFLPTVTVGQQYMKTNRYGDTSCYSSYGSPHGWSLQCPNSNSKYRTMDGSCNNVRHPYWGKSYVCHIRLLPPDYADGVAEPRLSRDGSPLPNSRTISNIVAEDKPFESFYTHLKMSFGQYVNHDITHTPVFGSYALSSSYSGPTDCCRDRRNKQCYPIDIEPTPHDYQYRKYNNTCLNFVRSAPCPLCELGPRQQMNIATSFIDCGTVYGNTLNDSLALRTFRYGLMKTGKDIYGKPILPPTPAPYQNECSPPTAKMQCFTAGDQRCNQYPALMSMHLIFLRRHIEHVTALRLVNPHWNDEILYQEGRRLVIAELQHITYDEYLPIIFGTTLMNYYSLNVSPRGYTLYEPNTDPTSWNDYATAACRFGHSQIKGFHSLYNGKSGGYNSTDGYRLRDRYMDPSFLWNGKFDGLLLGLTNDYSYSVDPYFTNDIRNYLLRKKGDLFGSDLIARNIQRGRDHGLPSYANYLKYCFGFQVRSWEDLKLFIPEYIVNLFQRMYKSPFDLDLFIAGASERHFPDADVGPTFACILGIQYYHLKFGDRYYYEHGGQSGSFNLAQLDNIRKTTSMARLICRTGDYIDSVQRYAFFPISNYNKLIPCRDYPEIDYQLWKESPKQRIYK